MTVKHTPTPWRTAQLGERIAFPNVHITGANGRPVASTMYPMAKSDWKAEDEANACFIILAVNAHANLLEALERIELLIRLAEFPSDEWIAAGRQLAELGVLVRDAIALARKKEEEV